mmetsp:Transcript_120918/g.341985  ORF Transcript_120918/g.341985 Transcript_120918/m.341985 type:complete len:571 (-) Transcript_120918:89-1801(-)|eukprot:CAMPEP_0117585160 /NCGR_PEP_ID=MMETSP0784-20121206/67993_1 /TAXON_ID=39447 /ORGANISM="" /LENGTH=570 /DNA_ID=CAMNT_0005386081 /DNA_START=23 /DNA_END=1735 /DNA_ORIENTATION=-
MSWSSDDLYGILGLGPDASADDIRSAYRRAALKHHPDKGGCADRFKLVGHAFETLFCPQSRAKYDFRKEAGQTGRFTACRSGVPAKGGAGKKAPRFTAAPTAGSAQSTAAGAKPASSPSFCKTNTSTSSRLEIRVEKLLARLARQIAALSREVRRQHVDRLTVLAKARLLRFVEADRAQQAAERRHGGSGAAPKATIRKTRWRLKRKLQDVGCRSRCGESCVSMVEHDEPIQLALDDAVRSFESDELGSNERATSEDSGGPAQRRRATQYPGIYVRQGQRYDLYVASVGLENFTIFSRNVRTLEEVVNYHIALMQVKRALETRTSDLADRCFAQRLQDALLEAPPLDDLRPSFYTVLTCGPAFGNKKIRSPATTDLGEALEHHRQLTQGRAVGHAALRAAWVSVLQSERFVKEGSRGNAIKKPRTFDEAEAIVAAAEHSASMLAQAKANRKSARVAARSAAGAASCVRLRRRCHQKSRTEHGDVPRHVRRLAKLISAVNAAVAKTERFRRVAAAKQRRAEVAHALAKKRLEARRLLQERRAFERQRRARWAWLRRSDLTFAQQQHGPHVV